MNNTLTKKLMQLMVLGVALVSLSACSKGMEYRASRTADGVNSNGNDTNNSCSSSTQATARVYDSGSASGTTFEQRVKGLLSALVDPQYFGTISGDANSTQTGVTIEGRIRYDSAGKIQTSQSSLKLVVTDSFVGQKDGEGKTVTAYPIQFNSASSGEVHSDRTFSAVFKDTLGEITVTGTLGGSTVTGKISYVNYTSFDGSAGASGDLGSFTLPTCAWSN